MYGESAWETLSRGNTVPDQVSDDASSGIIRMVYPELTSVAPNGTSTPSVTDLPGAARSDLNITWEGGDLVYVIVIDSSGSMGGTKISNTRTAAKLLVDIAELGSAIGVISFNSVPATVIPITRIPDQATKDTIKAAIDTISANGGTDIGGAAQVALDQLLAPSTPAGTKVVFLLSDGVSSGNPLSPIPAYQAAQIPIFSFSYGSDADTTTLGALATQTGGRLFISPISLAAVSQAFQSANTVAASASNIAFGSGTVSTGTESSAPLSVDTNLGSFILVLSYQGAASAATVTLVTPDGTILTPDQITQSGGETLILFLVEMPQAGEWQITVAGNGPPVSFEYQASGSPDGVTSTLTVDTFDGIRNVDSPNLFVLRASLVQNLPILNAIVSAEITDPTGNTVVLPMNDDGMVPDSVAGDGLYSAVVNYDQDGTYDVTIRAFGQAGIAVQSGSLLEPAAGLDGSFVPFPPPLPLASDFERFELLQIAVEGVVADDHGNGFENATALPAENLALVGGRIEIAGDVDVFEITVPEESDEIVIRVSNLAFGMVPFLSIFDELGELIKEDTLVSSMSQGGYLAVTVPTIGGEILFARVSDQSPDGIGWYQISAGPQIFKDVVEPPPVDACDLVCGNGKKVPMYKKRKFFGCKKRCVLPSSVKKRLRLGWKCGFCDA